MKNIRNFDEFINEKFFGLFDKKKLKDKNLPDDLEDHLFSKKYEVKATFGNGVVKSIIKTNSKKEAEQKYNIYVKTSELDKKGHVMFFTNGKLEKEVKI